MKTPREILLAKYEADQPALDTVRAQALRSLRPQRHGTSQLSNPTSAPSDWWQLLHFLRGQLYGLGAAWLLIGTLWIVRASDSGFAHLASDARPAARVTFDARENRRQLYELLQVNRPQDEEKPAPRLPSQRGQVGARVFILCQQDLITLKPLEGRFS